MLGGQMLMSNGIIFDVPKDGVRDDDTILIELTEDCPIDYANDIFNAFKKIYPKATISMLHPDLIKSVRFFHKSENYHPDLPF